MKEGVFSDLESLTVLTDEPLLVGHGDSFAVYTAPQYDVFRRDSKKATLWSDQTFDVESLSPGFSNAIVGSLDDTVYFSVGKKEVIQSIISYNLASVNDTLDYIVPFVYYNKLPLLLPK